MRTIHLISHTHWDREWYLTFQQFRIRLVHLIDHLLELLDQDPNFRHFMLDGQAIILEDYLAVRPEREKEIRTHVQKDRLIIGPWYILPDEFLVSPESTVRNLLEGERVCSLFGEKMQVGYIPDPFGHIGQMPQILRGFGIETACVQRGLSDEPCEFWWQAPDGSSVLMAYLRDGYGNAAGLQTLDLERFTSEAIRLTESLSPHSSTHHFLLMHGTDHSEPPVNTSVAISNANEAQNDYQIIHSTIPEYLEAINKNLSASNVNLPVIYGELRSPKRSPLLPGVLSTRIWIKQRNQSCELLLENWAEPFSTWAEILVKDDLSSSYSLSERLKNPASLLRAAWRLLLSCHPHDSICGCSIDQVHEEMRPRFDQVEQIGEEITHQSLATIVKYIDTRSQGNFFGAIVVFNPTLGPRDDLVEVEINLPKDVQDFEIVNKKGDILPYERSGLGSRELINIALLPAELRNSMGFVQDGHIMGMTIQNLEYTRQGNTIQLKLVLGGKGEPDLVAFQAGMRAIGNLLTDPTIERFDIIARSEDIIRAQFIAQDVPGPGVCTFWVRALPVKIHQTTELSSPLRLLLPLLKHIRNRTSLVRILTSRPTGRKSYALENEFIYVEVNPHNGSLSLHDKHSNALFHRLNSFIDGGDCGDTYNYCPPVQDKFFQETRLKHIEVHTNQVWQRAKLYMSLQIPCGLHENRRQRRRETVTLKIESTISLSTIARHLEIETTLENTARDHRLRVHFPLPFKVDHALYDGHYEIIERPLGAPNWDMSWVEQPRPEVPQRMFSDVSGGNSGLVLAVRSLPEVEVRNTPSGQSEIALTLLRCIGWLSRDDLSTRPGHAGPFLPTPGAQMPGKYTFAYALIPYLRDSANIDRFAAYQQARAFNSPLRALEADIHEGHLHARQHLISIEPNVFQLSAFKQAEDKQGFIARGFNPTKKPLLTTFLPWRKFNHAYICRLDETIQGRLIPDQSGEVKYLVPPLSVITIKFTD